MLAKLGENKKVLLGLVVVGLLFLIIGLALWTTGVVGWVGGLFMIFLGLVAGAAAGGLWYMARQRNKLEDLRGTFKYTDSKLREREEADRQREAERELAELEQQQAPPPVPPRDEEPEPATYTGTNYADDKEKRE